MNIVSNAQKKHADSGQVTESIRGARSDAVTSMVVKGQLQFLKSATEIAVGEGSFSSRQPR